MTNNLHTNGSKRQELLLQLLNGSNITVKENLPVNNLTNRQKAAIIASTAPELHNQRHLANFPDVSQVIDVIEDLLNMKDSGLDHTVDDIPEIIKKLSANRNVDVQQIITILQAVCAVGKVLCPLVGSI
jgi:hypothetical protein